MARPSLSGIYKKADGTWAIDKIVGGDRIQRRGVPSLAEAEAWLSVRIEELRALPAHEVPTFEAAAIEFIKRNENAPGLSHDILMLKPLMPHIGHLRLDQIDDEALKPFIAARKATKSQKGTPLKNSTVNQSIELVVRILNLAHHSWKRDGIFWLVSNPARIKRLGTNDKKAPVQLTWKGQRELLQELQYAHLKRMVLFSLNTGLRDNALVNLRWEWESGMPGLNFPVFVVPAAFVKGKKDYVIARVVVCNSVAARIIERCRGDDPEFVFVYDAKKKLSKDVQHPPRKLKPVQTINNSGFQSARRRAGWPGLRVQDLRHTFASRLRAVHVPPATISDLLWHAHPGMTANYTRAYLDALRNALELVARPGNLTEESEITIEDLLRHKRSQLSQAPLERVAVPTARIIAAR